MGYCWYLGIIGDLSILRMQIGSPMQLPRIRQLLVVLAFVVLMIGIGYRFVLPVTPYWLDIGIVVAIIAVLFMLKSSKRSDGPTRN